MNCAPVLTVTYHVFQLCGEKGVQPQEEFLEFSCYSDGSGKTFFKLEHQNLLSSIFGFPGWFGDK